MVTLSTITESLFLCLWTAAGAYMLIGNLVQGIVYYLGTGDGVMGRFGHFIEVSMSGDQLSRGLDSVAMVTVLRPNLMRAAAMLLGMTWIYSSAGVLGLWGIGMPLSLQALAGALLAALLSGTIEHGKVRYFKQADREVKQRLVDSEKDFSQSSKIFSQVCGSFHTTGQQINDYTAGGLLSGNIYAQRLGQVQSNLDLLEFGFRFGMWDTLGEAFVSIEDRVDSIRDDAHKEVEDAVGEQSIETEEGAHKILETGVDLQQDSIAVRKSRAREQFQVLVKRYHSDNHPNATQDEIDELNRKYNNVIRAKKYLKSIY